MLGRLIFSNVQIKDYASKTVHYRSDRILAEIRADILAHKHFPAQGNADSTRAADYEHRLNDTAALYGNIKYHVPNIIQYVILTRSIRSFGFTDYVSVISALKNQNPEQIWIHCNRDPVGHWWDELVQNISWHRLRVIHVDIPTRIGHISIDNPDHATDIVKMRILLKYGGIYIDTDILIIQNMDPLRRYHAVFGQEAAMKLSPAIILAEPNSTFLQLVLDNYHTDYHPLDPDYNIGLVPYRLAQANPKIVFLEVHDLVAPGFSKTHLLFSDNQALLDWHRFYAIHLRFRGSEGKVYNPDYIKPLKSIIGRILKYIYYGSEHVYNGSEQ